MERDSFSVFVRQSRSPELVDRLVEWMGIHPTRRLPSVREISQALRLSSRDVVAALEQLRREGRIETRPGSGSWPNGHLPTPPSRDTSRVDLIDKIREQIASGLHPTGHALPSAKSLAALWNCHPQTVRKALNILTGQGTLARDGRQWIVPRPGSSRHRQAERILLVGSANETGDLRMDSDREIDFWREISTEISRNGLESSRRIWDGEPLQIPAGTIGLIVSTWHQPESTPLLEAARATRRPVCTWLEGLDDATLQTLSHHHRLHLHDVAHSQQAGRDMGRHLLERSVRRLAWISPFQGAAWSRSREAGLRQSLEGRRVPLRHFGLDRISEWDFVAPAWSDPDLWETLHTTRLDALTGQRSHPVIAQAAEQLGLRWLMDALEPHLERALDWGADAWVACNDRIAALIKEWLVRRGRWDPNQLLLAGFDDSGLALRHDLTSYRFDTTAMARSMVRQILSYRPRDRPPHLVRHGGHVVVRGSTSKVAKLE